MPATVTARTAAICCIAIILCGCTTPRSYHHPELQLQPDMAVAVLPFTNLSGHANAGEIAAELFQAALNAECAQCMRLLPQHEVARALRTPDDKNLGVERLVASTLGAQAVLVGTVTEYSYKRGLGEEPAVGLSLRLVQMPANRVLWHSARSATGNYAWVRADNLSRLTQKLCTELAADLCRKGCSRD